MVANSSGFQRVQAGGWRRGFANLFAKENRAWWGSRRWLIQAVLWTVVIQGVLAFVVFVIPAMLPQMDPAEAETFEAVPQGLQALYQLGTIALGLGAVLLAQDQILGERLNGVTEWILSKPVSRPAYFLSKLAADAIGVLVVLVGLQSALAYGLLSLANGGPVAAGPYLVATAGLALHTLFYLVLTLAMGVWTESRGPLLGVPLGMLFGGLLLANMLGPVALFTPFAMAGVLPAAALGLEMPLPVGVPLGMTAALTLGCLALALRKLQKLEF